MLGELRRVRRSFRQSCAPVMAEQLFQVRNSRRKFIIFEQVPY